MLYSILTAPIKNTLEPTSSLRRPFKEVTRYTEQATIFDFKTEAEAIEFAQSYLPFDKVIVLPGTRKALSFYASVWVNEGDVCKQDLPKLAEQFADSSDWCWDYGKEMIESLESDIDEPDVVVDGIEVGSYTMGNSLLTGKTVPFSALCIVPEFEDLTHDEQLECMCPTTYNKKKATIDMGIMFDIHCRHKAGRFAKLYAYWIHHTFELGMRKYRVVSKVQRMYQTKVYAFNNWRLNWKEHP